MSRSLDDAGRAVGHACRDGDGLSSELVVEFAAQGEDRCGDRLQSVAKPVLSSRAAASQRLGETAGISAARGQLRGIRGEVGEEWLGEPLLKELVGADRLNVIGQVVITTSSVGPLRRVLDPARRAEQHEAAHRVGVPEGQVQCDASAKGVAAEIAARLQELGDEVGALVEGRPHGRRLAVARQVECPKFMSLCQNGAEPGCGTTGLGEAMEPDEHGSNAFAPDLEE